MEIPILDNTPEPTLEQRVTGLEMQLAKALTTIKILAAITQETFDYMSNLKEKEQQNNGTTQQN